MNNNELMAVENAGYMTEAIDLQELFSEELDGLRPTFDRIRVPAGGGLSFELPSDDPNNPDMMKEFSAVILYHYPSRDGKIGVVAETGECRECKNCPMAKWGSGENGGMACKQKRAMYLLREGELLPVVMTLSTGSLAEFTKYITRLVTKGKRANGVVTKFSLKRAQNSTGIAYSQVMCSVDRALNPDEQANISAMSEQVKNLVNRMPIFDED